MVGHVLVEGVRGVVIVLLLLVRSLWLRLWSRLSLLRNGVGWGSLVSGLVFIHLLENDFSVESSEVLLTHIVIWVWRIVNVVKVNLRPILSFIVLNCRFCLSWLMNWLSLLSWLNSRLWHML